MRAKYRNPSESPTPFLTKLSNREDGTRIINHRREGNDSWGEATQVNTSPFIHYTVCSTNVSVLMIIASPQCLLRTSTTSITVLIWAPTICHIWPGADHQWERCCTSGTMLDHAFSLMQGMATNSQWCGAHLILSVFGIKNKNHSRQWKSETGLHKGSFKLKPKRQEVGEHPPLDKKDNG